MTLSFADDAALAFALLFARASGMTMALPSMLGVKVPVRMRLLLAALLASALMPIARVAKPAYRTSTEIIGLTMGAELVTGALLAFFASLIGGAVLVAAETIAGAMELSSGPILRQLSPLGGLATLPSPLADGINALAVMLFFVAGLHRALIFALGASVEVTPLGALASPSKALLLRASAEMFSLALNIALPLLVPLLLLGLTQGVLSRFAPQMNLLMAGPSAMILAGLELMLLYSGKLGVGLMQVWERAVGLVLALVHG